MKRFLHSTTRIRKLRSFTLTEILIATMLSAILLAFVVTVFSFLMNRVRSENNNMDRMEDLLLLQSGLQEAARMCDSVLIVDDQICFYRAGETGANAEFADSLIILHLHEACDTFELSAENVRFTYLGKTPLISSIEYDIDFRSFSVPCSMVKEYDGAVMVNAKISIR